MDDNNSMDVNLTDLDLNQEPIDSTLHRVSSALDELQSVGRGIGERIFQLEDEPMDSTFHRVARAGSVMNELEEAHVRIEERIRQLEAVTARARQRQRWRQARDSMEIDHFVGTDGVNGNSVERTPERGVGCKRDSSHLVAKALEMDSEIKKVDKEGGSFYDCNICLDLATEPVLTCCGHLFCWACFYQVSYIDSTSKECPVCKGEVSDSTVTPIYGNGSSERVHELDSGLKIPPRPKACRVESVRQQRVSQGLSHVPVAEALRRIRISIGAMTDQTQVTQQLDGGNTILNFNTESPERQSAEAGGARRIRIHQVSRVLSESAASLSSLSSALSNAERLVEDLESVINNRFSRNEVQAPSADVGNPSTRQMSNQLIDASAVIDAAFPITSSSQSTDVSGSVLRIVAVRTSGEISLPVVPSAPSSSQRRRSVIPRASDADNRDVRESRRRRLN